MPALELTFRAAAAPGWAAWVLLALIALATLGAHASRRALVGGEALPPLRALYPQLALQLGAVGLVAALASRELALEVWRRPAPSAGAWAWGGLALAAMLAAAALLWRVTPADERARRAALIPATSDERALLVLLACVAGLAEELAWRAVLPALIARWTGSAWAGVALAAGSFGLAHALQGRLAMGVVLVLALVFQGLVEVAGSLWVAVAVHAAYDAGVGLWLAPRLRDRG